MRSPLIAHIWLNVRARQIDKTTQVNVCLTSKYKSRAIHWQGHWLGDSRRDHLPGAYSLHNTSREPSTGKAIDRGAVTGNIYRGPNHRIEPSIPKPRLASNSKSKSASSNQHTTNGHFVHIIAFSCHSIPFILDQRSHPLTSSYRTITRCHHHAFSDDLRHEGVP